MQGGRYSGAARDIYTSLLPLAALGSGSASQVYKQQPSLQANTPGPGAASAAATPVIPLVSAAAAAAAAASLGQTTADLVARLAPMDITLHVVLPRAVGDLTAQAAKATALSVYNQVGGWLAVGS